MRQKLRTLSTLMQNYYREKTSRFGPRLMQVAYGLPTVQLSDIVRENIEVKLPIPDDICMPPYHGPSDHDDYSPLMMIVKSLQPKIVVELGTAHGNTVANICRECPQTKIYTVNAPIGDQSGIMTTYQLTREEIGRVYRAHSFADRVVQIFMNTLDLELSGFIDSPIVDIAIIDACHDTDYVLNDFEKVQPFVRPGGVVLFHDTHPSMKFHLLGSYRACMMLRRKGYDIAHIKDTWWGVWVNDDAFRIPVCRVD